MDSISIRPDLVFIRGRGVIIHRHDCESVARLSSSRFIKVDWNTDNISDDTSFVSSIDILAKQNSNIYVEVTNAFNECGIKIISLNTTTTKLGELQMKIGVLVKDRHQLQQIKNKLSSLSSVFEVKQ